MRDNKAQAMLLASFAADALALCAHWIYDPQKIRDDFGLIRTYQKPPASSYHNTKGKGDFTHYGDQALLLLHCLDEQGAFSLDFFADKWRSFMAGYAGYMDKASQQTLANFRAGTGPDASGSPSSDLAGASRIASLIYIYRENHVQELISAVRAQTKMTHNNPLVMASAEFFGRTALAILDGSGPIAALEGVAETHFAGSPLAQWVSQGIKTRAADTVQTITGMGQTCQVQDAFPGVIHLVAKHEHNLEEALIQCVMAGGDSAGRGMLVGLLLGAHLGMDALPPSWIEEMHAYPTIRNCLDHFNP